MGSDLEVVNYLVKNSTTYKTGDIILVISKAKLILKKNYSKYNIDINHDDKYSTYAVFIDNQSDKLNEYVKINNIILYNEGFNNIIIDAKRRQSYMCDLYAIKYI